jgi:hypothetical protein
VIGALFFIKTVKKAMEQCEKTGISYMGIAQENGQINTARKKSAGKEKGGDSR